MNVLLNFKEELYFILALLTTITVEYYFKKTKKQIKDSIHEKYGEITEGIDSHLENDEFYISYYKKIQFIDLIRVVIAFIFVFGVILYKSPSAFSFLAIAAGAIIVTFKDAILSFLGFFYIMTNYKIGDIIILGDNVGEILYIKPLFVGAVGKDENGEHNGQFYILPNSKFITDIIKKEDLKITNFKKEVLTIYFSKKEFNMDFIEFHNKLVGFLDSKFDIKTVDDVGNYKTFIGYKYKLRFDYDKDFILVKLVFIEKPINSLILREEIVIFIESIKNHLT